VTPSFVRPIEIGLERGDVRRLESLGTLNDVELDPRALREGAEALTLNRREVHEHVLATFHGDESKALRIVEPLDSTGATHSWEISFLLLPCCWSEIRLRWRTSSHA